MQVELVFALQLLNNGFDNDMNDNCLIKYSFATHRTLQIAKITHSRHNCIKNIYFLKQLFIYLHRKVNKRFEIVKINIYLTVKAYFKFFFVDMQN